jgi:hypothetical protein
MSFFLHLQHLYLFAKFGDAFWLRNSEELKYESQQNHAEANCDKPWMLDIDDCCRSVVGGHWTTGIAEIRSTIDRDPEQGVVFDTKGVFCGVPSRISM